MTRIPVSRFIYLFSCCRAFRFALCHYCNVTMTILVCDSLCICTRATLGITEKWNPRKVKISAILDMAKMLSKALLPIYTSIAHMRVPVAYNTGFPEILISSNMIESHFVFIFIYLRLTFYSYIHLWIARAYLLPIFLLDCSVLLLICEF